MPRRKTGSSRSIAPIPRFGILSKEVEAGIYDVRLRTEGAAAPLAVDVEIAVDRLTWIPREFIESMGGDAPYDRFETLWPLGEEHELTINLALQTIADETKQRSGADLLPFTPPLPIEVVEEDLAGGSTSKVLDHYSHTAVTTFQPDDNGVWCQIGTSVFRFVTDQFAFLHRPGTQGQGGISLEPCTMAEFHDALKARNDLVGAGALEAQPRPQPRFERRERDFVLHTGEEWTAFIQSASDGRHGEHFSGNEQSGILRHQRPNAPFFTETILLEEERRAGHGIELLQNAAAQLDIDDGLSWLYISHLLAPPSPLAANAYAGGWVDLDDVARKTLGGYARNPKEAAERRSKIWRAIRYGARSHIGGKRSVPYFDKTSGKEIQTEIYTSPWQIVSRQQIGQMPLFGDDDAAPVRVELVASREWTALTTEASTAQYLPFGEILGALPANQAGGAWARVLGLAYINWCRRRLKQAIEAEEIPTRRELLDAFPSKVAPYRDILAGSNPLRALTYWQSAEMLLKEAEIIETSGEIYKPVSRKGWQPLWLGERPDWKPGAMLRPVLEGLDKKRFPQAPRQLGKPTRKRTKRRDIPAPE
jgi:hypothetical protein